VKSLFDAALEKTPAERTVFSKAPAVRTTICGATSNR